MISISFLSITFIPFYSCWHFFLSLYRSSATFLSRSLISQLLPLLTSHRWFISTFSHFISNIAPFLLFPQFSNHKTLYFHPRILTFFLSYLSASEPCLNFVLSPDKITQKYLSYQRSSLQSTGFLFYYPATKTHTRPWVYSTAAPTS